MTPTLIITAYIAFLFALGCYVYRWTRKEKQPQVTDEMITAFNNMVENIRGAKDEDELERWEMDCYRFEETFRGRMHIYDKFIDLLGEIQGRCNVLAVEKIGKQVK